MARATTTTWLPLDRWAQIIGENPLYFNQLDSPTLFPGNTSCGEVWMQNSWQNSQRISREDLAFAIRSAEDIISNYVGYNLLPDWRVSERVEYATPFKPELLNANWRGTNGKLNSVRLDKGYLISGGRKARSVIEAGATVVRTDSTGDGYKDLVTVTITTSLTNTNEIRAFYAGKDGADEYEIRPINVVLQGAGATITFNSWQIVGLNQQERFGAEAIDADDDTVYDTTVDIYRVYNDPSSQVVLIWEEPNTIVSGCSSCAACQLGTQNGCIHIRDKRIGNVVPQPATWNETTEQFDAVASSVCRQPDMANISYYSGWVDNNRKRPDVELDPFWEYAIAYFAAALLDRPLCGCSNAHESVKKYQMDRAHASEGDGVFSNVPHQISNVFGTTVGAKYAYDRASQEGRKIGR